MISKALMKQTFKSNMVLWVVMTLVQAACLVLMSAQGMSVEMTGRAFYAILPEILSAIYIISTGNKLLAAQVDRGTMAYILSTPVKRSKVALTQTIFFVTSLFTMYAVTAITHIVSSKIALDSFSSSDVQTVIKLNLGLFILSLAFSGICFMASGIFNLSKYAISIGGGVVGAFLLFSLLASFGGNLANLKYFTISTLYDLTSITSGNSDFVIKLIILVGIGIVTYYVGINTFSKKDLPL